MSWKRISHSRPRPTITSRSTGKVYIADPSQTVSGGTAIPLAVVSIVVLPSSAGRRLRSVGDIHCFLYPGSLLPMHTNISVHQRRQVARAASRPLSDLIDAKP